MGLKWVMAVDLRELLTHLQALAPLHHAEPWDNVGLLIDPRHGPGECPVDDVLLTIDATPEVLTELEGLRRPCLVAYHPPLFRPLKRLSHPDQSIVFVAARLGIPVYSPHTALDSAPGGLNDWLAQAAGPGTVRALRPHSERDPEGRLKLVVFTLEENADELRRELSAVGAGEVFGYEQCSFLSRGTGCFLPPEGSSPAVGAPGALEKVDEVRLEMPLLDKHVAAATEVMQRVHPYERPLWYLQRCEEPPDARFGAGRHVTLAEPVALEPLIERIKRALGVPTLRLAAAPGAEAGRAISTVTVAAGSGGSLFSHGPPADLYLTGECGHHEVLGLLRRGASVVLAEHSSSERGYLTLLQQRLQQRVGQAARVRVSAADREPLRVV